MNTFLLHLASVAVLVIAVETACRLGRFRPAICHALWLVVLVKLVVPPVVAWPMSAEVLAAMLAAPVSNDAIAAGSAGGNTGRTGIMAGGWSFGLNDTEASPATDSGTASWVTPVSVMSGLWALGALAVVARIAMHVRRGRRRIAAGEALPAWLQSRLAQSCALLGVPVPRAVIAREAGGVYIQITGRPTLVISAEALEHVGADQWHTILTHELAHLKRRDHWVAWLLLAAGAVWWWNPCFWWVRNRIHLYSEMACDAWVVNVHPGDRKQYAETMVRIMAMLSRQDAPAPAMGLAAWSAATQERRLWMIMKAKGGCRVPWLGAAGVAVVAALVSPAWLADSAEESKKPDAAKEAEAGWVLSLEPTEELKEALGVLINLTLKDSDLDEIAKSVQESVNINVVVDQRVIAPESESADGGVVLPDSDKDTGMSDGLIPYIKLLDAPAGEVLKASTRPLGLTTQIRGNTVWLSTKKQLTADEQIPLPSADFSEGPLLETLSRPAQLEFEEAHIKEILEFLQDNFEINLVLDKRAFTPERDELGAQSPDSPGTPTDGMIHRISLNNVPLGEALYVVTRLVNLTYTVKENYIYIATPELIDSLDVPPPTE